jgi:hypothetical protein
MKIKIKSVLASANGLLAPGDTVEVDDATADMLIRKGIAEPVKAAPSLSLSRLHPRRRQRLTLKSLTLSLPNVPSLTALKKLAESEGAGHAFNSSKRP